MEQSNHTANTRKLKVTTQTRHHVSGPKKCIYKPDYEHLKSQHEREVSERNIPRREQMIPGYSKPFSPRTLLRAFFVVFTKYLIARLFAFLGLSRFTQTNNLLSLQNTSITCLPTPTTAKLIQEVLPGVKYKELDAASYSTETCAICLSEFEAESEISWLKNCKHIFHRRCLNRWVDHDQDMCPLCRKSLFPDEMQEEYEQRL